MTINPQRAQALFYAALELSEPTARRELLDRECDRDAALRQRVEALLGAHDAAGGFGEETSGPGYDPTIFKPVSEHLGIVIAGRYKLLEAIGEGGMGSVWVAEQFQPVKRKVALKLIKAGMDSRSVLARFEAERQALAVMDHPNIAKVLDGGLTPMGQPFFVMELVNGLPLNTFCDEAKLTPKDRLELFVSICQAVQHAHQKGIVHRDLKPANILVTLVDGKPVPKVIDFGVAKAMEGKLTEETMSTGFGAVVGTLEYMSPEQAGFSSDDIDTRSDIYSLGVILYELLTGLRPIDGKRLRKAALIEMVRMIREEEPFKPSTRLSGDASLPSAAALRQIEPRMLMSLLRGELDWVVMKALEKDRKRRYETASELSKEIQRYLANEPVEARPPTMAYQWKKFYQRNRLPILAAIVVVASTFLGSCGVLWGYASSQRAETMVQKLKIATIVENCRKRLGTLVSEKDLDKRINGSLTEATVLAEIGPDALPAAAELAQSFRDVAIELDQRHKAFSIQVSALRPLVGALMSLGPNAKKEVANLVNDPNHVVGIALLKMLETPLKFQSADYHWETTEWEEEVLLLGLASGNASLRQQAVHSLGGTDRRRSKRIRQAIESLRDDPDTQVRDIAWFVFSLSLHDQVRLAQSPQERKATEDQLQKHLQNHW